MIKQIYKQKGWTATSAIVRQNFVEVKLAIDHRYNFCCTKCHAILKPHSVREICVRDLPIADKDVTLYVDTMQGYCVCCNRYLTLRPEICHPSYGYTWRLMRLLSRSLVHTPARFLQDEYSISYSTILRIDKEVLDKIRRFTMKHPSYTLEQFMKGKRYVLLKGRENINQDARATLKELSILNRDLYIGYLLKEQFRQVFQTRDENTATLRLILWIKMCMRSKVKILRNFSRKISEQFNEVINGIRYKINSARIESANAAIKRILSKACGLFDVRYLFLKLRQIYFLRLQRMHKTSRFFYQQI